MEKYLLNSNLEENITRAYLQDWINDVEDGANIEDLFKNLTIYGIMKDVEYKVTQVDRPMNEKFITKKVPIGIIALKVNPANDSMMIIELLYIAPEFSTDFPEVYTFVLSEIKKNGYNRLAMLCNGKTSRFIAKNTESNKAKIFYHYGGLSDFDVKEVKKELPLKEDFKTPELVTRSPENIVFMTNKNTMIIKDTGGDVVLKGGEVHESLLDESNPEVTIKPLDEKPSANGFPAELEGL